MPETGYIAVFLIGLLGGTHCVGMCGGIVGALTVTRPGSRPDWQLHAAYNLGRITSYTVAGAALGAIGGLGMVLNNVLPVQMALYLVANLMLIALGLYLTGMTSLLAPLERAGHRVWTRIQPLTARFLPARRIAQAYPLGLLWGFLPCGLVYSVLATALVSGSALRGAGLLLAFGLGTLPNLMLAGMLLTRLRYVTRQKWLRIGSGVLVLGFGVFGLVNAGTLGGKLWQGVVCHV
jgi:sulfite exporter TauE/SafE